MDTLIFATNNQHKVDEIRKVLGNIFDVVTLKEAGIFIDIPEPYAPNPGIEFGVHTQDNGIP